MYSIDAAVAALAARQHGVVSNRQVIDLGGSSTLIDRRLRSGHWFRQMHGVYRIGGAPITYELRVMAAVLSLGEGTLASHRTGARLRGLLPAATDMIELSVPRNRHATRPGVIVHRSRDLHLASPQVVNGIPVTGLARTILDLGAVSPHLVMKAVNAAMRAHAIEWDDLLRVLVVHGRRGRRGAGPLRRIVAQHYGELASDSDTEDVAYSILMASGMVPRPEKQVTVMCADGVEVDIDLGWPEQRAYLEVFGVDHLTNEPLQHLDLHRRNQIELAGNSLLVYTGRLLEQQPDQFVTDVLRLLSRAGCPGLVLPA